MVECWRCCGVWCVVCDVCTSGCVECVCMWCCAWVLCGGGGGCGGVVLVLCWSFLFVFSFFSQLSSLSFSFCLPFLSSLSFLLLFSLLSSFFSFSLSLFHYLFPNTVQRTDQQTNFEAFRCDLAHLGTWVTDLSLILSPLLPHPEKERELLLQEYFQR